MDRYIELLNFLGKKYDGNPYVEAIVAIGETGVSVASPPADLNAAAFNTQLKRLVDALVTNWPTTNKVINNNWGATNTDAAALLSVSQYAASKGVGFGGPDILYAPYQETDGSLIHRGAGGRFGTTDYRLKIPSIYRESGAWSELTAAGVENYAYGTLKATHVMWQNHPGDHTTLLNWVTGLVPALNAVAFRVVTACPTSYVNGCKMQ
jgi:hypothetical protein